MGKKKTGKMGDFWGPKGEKKREFLEKKAEKEKGILWKK